MKFKLRIIITLKAKGVLVGIKFIMNLRIFKSSVIGL